MKLCGTSKQVEWSKTIRDKFIENMSLIDNMHQQNKKRLEEENPNRCRIYEATLRRFNDMKSIPISGWWIWKRNKLENLNDLQHEINTYCEDWYNKFYGGKL